VFYIETKGAKIKFPQQLWLEMTNADVVEKGFPSFIMRKINASCRRRRRVGTFR
jgi:hypothetical protein